MKTALVYDWFSDIKGGGEKAFDAVYELYPGTIHTLLYSPRALIGASFEKAEIHSSFIQKLPRALTQYRRYLPLFPLAIEQFDLSSYDLIISSSHCAAKGVLTNSDQIHLCYCYTPMRYAWDLYHQYLDESNIRTGIKGRLAQFFLHYLRMWDCQTAHRVDSFACISNYVAKRIKKTYNRDAITIYPPVDTEFYSLEEKKDDYYLTASRLVPYKKIDLIVDAFSQMPEKKLIVIGDGPDAKKIKEKAGKNVELLGYQDDQTLKRYLQKAKAFIFAAVEDFGMLPVEAQSCGTPVIAYGKGAALETVEQNTTGIFFQEQSISSLCDAIARLEQSMDTFNPQTLHRYAQRFAKKRFSTEFQNWVEGERKKCTFSS